MKFIVLLCVFFISSQGFTYEKPRCEDIPTPELYLYNTVQSPLLRVRPGFEKAVFEQFANDPLCNIRKFELRGIKRQVVTEVEFIVEYENSYVFFWELLVRCNRIQIEGASDIFRCEVVSGT
jgi:hypothetical protein